MSKKTFIAFSDQHLEAKLYNLPELEQDNRTLFSMVVDTAIELKVDYLVSAGDLFDSNKPTSETIKFVTNEITRLRYGGVTPVAIAGDHSKPVNGATWETVCGFGEINDVPEFVGVDYSDNPAYVIEKVNRELQTRPTNSIEFMFLHQQIPELWPFCDEKKTISMKDLDLSNQCGSLVALLLGDIHIRRDMRYMDMACNKDIFVGYCGSLGVTASNETKKEGLYYWDGNAMQLIEYKLPRKFITLDCYPDSVHLFKPELFAVYRDLPAKPVFLCKLHDGTQPGNIFNFLYDIGHVKMTKIRKNADGQEEMINIRSELKTAERFAAVLRELTQDLPNFKQVYDTAYQLLTEDDPKTVLDKLKESIIQ